MQITAEQKKTLEERFEALQKEKAMISRRIGLAREQGDLSENAEYHAAREALAFTLREISMVADQLEGAVISNTEFNGSVQIGTTVSLETVFAGETETEEYTIADVGNGLSTKSPIGKAINGQKKGFETDVQLPRGVMHVKILNVRK
jgi:transcription elongation factor GreA